MRRPGGGMRWKAMWLTTLATFLIGPASASACDTYLGYTFKRITGAMDLGGGLQIQPGKDGAPTYVIPSVDLSIELGGAAVIRPAIGLCTTAAGSSRAAEGEAGTDIVVGGGFAWNFWNAPAGNLGINLQAAVTHVSYEGGSGQTIPITAAGELRASDAASVWLGLGLQIGRDSLDGGTSVTDTDPVGFAGTTLDGGALDFSIAVQLKKGDTDTDFAINAAFAVPLG